MKTKNFQAYLEKRFDQEEIADIKAQAELEIKILRSIQKRSADLDDTETVRLDSCLPTKASSFANKATMDKSVDTGLLLETDIL